MTFRKMKGNFERLFDKNLTDLVRGIRNNKNNEAKYIAQCIEEIKEELKQDNISVKTNAAAKLTYLQMLGYDISWAAFNIIEVMSSTKFTYKRIGYLSASQCFHENTEVMMLTTNMIRKDLNSQNIYDAGCAMSGLACFISSDISRDLANDVMTLLTSTKPYLRKKAVLLIYKIFLKYPEALKPAFPRLKERLEDPDPGVQSAAVNVICELARKNPKNYLPLAPVFFKLMTNSTNNWMLIKIIKLFGALTPLEPRLGKKLIEPLTNLIQSTSAMSLLYECINTVIAVLISISSGLPNTQGSIQLCVGKLRILIEDSDHNLKYLGLLALGRILRTHPKVVQTHKDLVLGCLDDRDESIRLRALDLLYGMVSKKNLMEIVKKLMDNVSDSCVGHKYRDELIAKIIDICSQNDYQYVVNFKWYVSLLFDLTLLKGPTDHGPLIAQQFLDVAVRVDSIRDFVTKQMPVLIDSSSQFTNTSIREVLYAASWICGEFSQYLPNKKQTVQSLLKKHSLPTHIESAFIHNASKILAKIVSNEYKKLDGQRPSEEINDANEDATSLIDFCELLISNLNPLLMSEDLEVQERSHNLLQMLLLIIEELKELSNSDNTSIQENNETSETCLSKHKRTEFDSLFFPYQLNPVAAIAQRKVPIPQGLDLDEAFVTEEVADDLQENGFQFMSEEEEEEDEEVKENEIKNVKGKVKGKRKGHKIEKKVKIDTSNNPHYLKSKKNKEKIEIAEEARPTNEEREVCSKNLISGLISSESFLDKKSKKKGKSKEDSGDEAPLVTIRGLEMPEGADLNDSENDNCLDETDPHRALARFNFDDIMGDNKLENKTKKKKTVKSKGKDLLKDAKDSKENGEGKDINQVRSSKKSGKKSKVKDNFEKKKSSKNKKVEDV